MTGSHSAPNASGSSPSRMTIVTSAAVPTTKAICEARSRTLAPALGRSKT
jgi:hypothetical protein